MTAETNPPSQTPSLHPFARPPLRRIALWCLRLPWTDRTAPLQPELLAAENPDGSLSRIDESTGGLLVTPTRERFAPAARQALLSSAVGSAPVSSRAPVECPYNGWRDALTCPSLGWRSEQDPPGTTLLPPPVSALNAREAAVTGNDVAIDQFTVDILSLPPDGLWREAVSTALLGDWITPLVRGGQLTVDAVRDLRCEAQTIHRQLMPLWQRRTRHGRVWRLDLPLGDGFSLYERISSQRWEEANPDDGIDDDRLAALFRGLDDSERAVVLARSRALNTTWTEAAAQTGATYPQVLGERVRRKVKRLIDEQNRRRTQSGQPWLPSRGSRS